MIWLFEVGCFLLVDGWIVALCIVIVGIVWFVCLFGVLIGLGLGLYTLRVIVLLVGLLWLWVFGFCYVFLVITWLVSLCFDCLVCFD